jgi:cyclophilin family peptidyl-prolyl cis-trans isomerase
MLKAVSSGLAAGAPELMLHEMARRFNHSARLGVFAGKLAGRHVHMHLPRGFVLGLTLVLLGAAASLTGCGGSDPVAPAASAGGDVAAAAATPAGTSAATSATAGQAKPAPKALDPVVTLHTSAGDIKIQLFTDKAPQAVENFLRNYAQRGFYDDTIFHHAESGSMIIAGGYTEALEPKPTRAPILNEADNGLKNTRGMVAMIRDPSLAHSATSQFFINVGDNPALDYQSAETPESWGYCVFGKVIEGMDVVDQIAQSSATADGDFPMVPTPRIAIRNVEQLR